MKKHLAQIRIDEELHKKAKEQAEKRGTQFSGYVTELIKNDIEFNEKFFPYIVLDLLSKVYINEPSRTEYNQSKKILLLKKLNSVSYDINFTKDRIENTIKRDLNREQVWGNPPTFKMTATNFSEDDCKPPYISHYSIAGLDAELTFPQTPSGFTVDLQIDFSLYSPWLTRHNTWPIEMNSSGYFFDVPTKKLTLELYIKKELYKYDFEKGIFTEEQILNSAEFVFGSQIMLYHRVITYEDQEKYNISITRKNESDYFVFKLEVIRPIFGINYRIYWLKPLKNLD